MFPEPKTHHALWTAAGLASGWPVFRALRAEEVDVESLLLALASVVGPVPQAVIDVPEVGERWRLEVPLPNIEPDQALLLSELGGWWTPGPRPDVVREIEQGGLWLSSRPVAGCLAMRWQGQPEAWRQLRRSNAVDDAVTALEARVVEVIRAVDPALQLQSDRGPDTLVGVRDEATGRFGVWLSLATAPEPMAVLEALAGVVAQRAEHSTLRLAPDLLWRPMLDGMDVVMWAIAPAIPVPWTVAPHRRLVLHILEDWEATVHKAAGLAEALCWPAGSTEWRWAEGGWHFCPTWVPDPEEGADTEEMVRALSALGPVELVGRDPDEA
jgi:hypothetical protein